MIPVKFTHFEHFYADNHENNEADNLLNHFQFNQTKRSSVDFRFAGTMAVYSNNATPQLAKMMRINGQSLIIPISDNFKLPYHANVIKMFETIKSNTV